MNSKLIQLARVASVIFHPLLIPTLGFFLLLNSGFYFALLPWAIKKFMLLIVFLSTCVLPLLSILLLSLSPRFDLKMEKNTDRVLPLMITAIYYYVGYLIMKKIPVSPIFNFVLVSSILVQIMLIIISLQWKISTHAAAIGGLLGGYFGLSFRLQENPALIISALILVAGLVGTSRLILGKHTNAQVYAGFLVGFLILDLVIVFV